MTEMHELPYPSDESPAEQAAAGDSAPRLSEEGRLAQLAERATARPTFAADKPPADKVYLPGREDEWIIPRPLTYEDVLRLEAIMARATTWMRPGQGLEAAKIETQPRRDEYFLTLCGLGIQEYCFKAGNGWRRGKYHRNPSARTTERDCAELDPVIGEWLQLYLERYNGISEEQRRELGNL